MSGELTCGQEALLLTDLNEKNRRFVHNAIELVLSFGDFQKQIDSACSPQMIFSETIRRIERIIRFESSALLLVDEESADLVPCMCIPETAKNKIEQELEFLIENGFLAWAMRERRGVSVYSRDGSHQILLHAMATYSRVRGFFIGCFPADLKGLPDTAMEILSIILRNTANVLESIYCMDALKRQNGELESRVAEKTQSLLRFERQLMQARKTEAIAALAGGVAHQYNNALAGLIGHIDLLALVSQESEELKRFLKGVRPITEKMTHLTHQLLSYAHGGPFNPQPLRLEELIKSTMPVFRRSVKPTIRIETDFRDSELSVRADPMQLQLALSAIVNNANEAMEEQGKILIRAFKMTLCDGSAASPIDLPSGDYACLGIQDAGKGMDDRTLNRLFEPFFTTKFEGRGLGMAAVQGIVQSHHGAIDVTSRPGHGTLVQLFLPLHAGMPAHPA